MRAPAISDGCARASLWPDFSHLYVEREAADTPAAVRIIERFSRSRVILIDRFGELFNRANQDWRLQKKSPKLILARRRDGFVYRCSEIAPSFGHSHFYYNTLMMNCTYDCDYCYLQGMYPSANLVIFVNTDDYFRATTELLRRHPVYLCISYDTDLLALEAVYPYTRQWIEFARSQPELLIEVRTKSANYRLIRDLAPTPNAVLAWTLSPEPVARRFEPRTPGLSQRLASLCQALDDGWPVRLCFDPLLWVDDWEMVYDRFLDRVLSQLDCQRVRDVTLGVFRMNRDYLKRIRRRRSDSRVIHDDYQVEGRVATYCRPRRQQLIEHVRARLLEVFPQEKVFVV